ncbi:MAG: 3-isopropylmalate dehydratase [Methanomicrobiales archaeon HGW-Methanomicrobiales-4]|nr:MAG: 3-isopropylmalate dehydratase [Methanomicrobiales archaeon HGW-Methanomicrobiales-4]
MRVWKFGDNIDTDAMIPGRFLTINDPKGLAEHAFEGFRDDFAGQVREGDMIVAGRNFGCGSSREHAPMALTGSGIRVVIAESFARIFYRNSVNVGLLPVICPRAGEISEKDQLTLHLAEGFIEVSGKKFEIEPVPEFLQRIIDAGGLVEYAKQIKGEDLCMK